MEEDTRANSRSKWRHRGRRATEAKGASSRAKELASLISQTESRKFNKFDIDDVLSGSSSSENEYLEDLKDLDQMWSWDTDEKPGNGADVLSIETEVFDRESIENQENSLISSSDALKLNLKKGRTSSKSRISLSSAATTATGSFGLNDEGEASTSPLSNRNRKSDFGGLSNISVNSDRAYLEIEELPKDEHLENGDDRLSDEDKALKKESGQEYQPFAKKSQNTATRSSKHRVSLFSAASTATGPLGLNDDGEASISPVSYRTHNSGVSRVSNMSVNSDRAYLEIEELPKDEHLENGDDRLSDEDKALKKESGQEYQPFAKKSQNTATRSSKHRVSLFSAASTATGPLGLNDDGEASISPVSYRTRNSGVSRVSNISVTSDKAYLEIEEAETKPSKRRKSVRFQDEIISNVDHNASSNENFVNENFVEEYAPESIVSPNSIGSPVPKSENLEPSFSPNFSLDQDYYTSDKETNQENISSNFQTVQGRVLVSDSEAEEDDFLSEADSTSEPTRSIFSHTSEHILSESDHDASSLVSEESSLLKNRGKSSKASKRKSRPRLSVKNTKTRRNGRLGRNTMFLVNAAHAKNLLAENTFEEENGVRRSKRQRIAPLKFWCNERIVMKRQSTGFGQDLPVVTGAVVRDDISETESASSKTRVRKAGSHYRYSVDINRKVESFHPIFDAVSGQEKLESVHMAEGMLEYQPCNKNVQVASAFDNNIFTNGLMIIPPSGLKSKDTCEVPHQFVVISCAKDALQITINDTHFNASTGDMFWVPKANIYSMKNLSESHEAKLHICLFNQSIPHKPSKRR